MNKGTLTGERKIVNGRVVIRRKKSDREALASADEREPKKEVKTQDYETRVKRQIAGFLND